MFIQNLEKYVGWTSTSGWFDLCYRFSLNSMQAYFIDYAHNMCDLYSDLNLVYIVVFDYGIEAETNSQHHFKMHFPEWKSVISLFKFHWNLFPKVQLKISQYWLR